jgi:hypothetical protein
MTMSGADLSEEDIHTLAHRLDQAETVEPRLAGMVGYARMIGFEDVPDQEEVAVALRLLHIGVAAQPTNDPDACQWLMAAGLGYGYRANVTNAPEDWGVAISWAELAVKTPHPSKDDYDDAVTVLAELHEARALGLEIKEPILLDAYVEAMAHAVAVNEDVEELYGQYSLMLVRALTIRWRDEEEPPEVQEQILESLAVAVRTTDNPEVWDWYGSQLYPRAVEQDNADDVRTALYWMGRYVAASGESVEDISVCRVMLAVGYDYLWSRTGDLADADLAIEHATEALRFPVLDNETTRGLHRIRMEALFPDGGRPDLAELMTAKPVLEWLAEARRAAGSTDEDSTGELARLARSVGQGWVQTRTSGEPGGRRRR